MLLFNIRRATSHRAPWIMTTSHNGNTLLTFIQSPETCPDSKLNPHAICLRGATLCLQKEVVLADFCPAIWIIRALSLTQPCRTPTVKNWCCFAPSSRPESCHMQHGVCVCVGDWWVTSALQANTKPNHQQAQINLIAPETGSYFLPSCFTSPAPLCLVCSVPFTQFLIIFPLLLRLSSYCSPTLSRSPSFIQTAFSYFCHCSLDLFCPFYPCFSFCLIPTSAFILLNGNKTANVNMAVVNGCEQHIAHYPATVLSLVTYFVLILNHCCFPLLKTNSHSWEDK